MNAAQSIVRNSDSVKAMGMLDAGLAKWSTSQASALGKQDQIAIRNSTFFALTRFFRLLLHQQQGDHGRGQEQYLQEARRPQGTAIGRECQLY